MRSYGIITTPSGTIASLVVTSFTRSGSVEVYQGRDVNGRVTVTDAYSRSETLNVRGFLDASAPAVIVGSTIVISGSTFMVTDAELLESNTEFVEYSFICFAADSATYTAYDPNAVIYVETPLPVYLVEDRGSVVYLCFTTDPTRAVQRITINVSGETTTTVMEVAYGIWANRASLTYYPINQPVPVQF